MSKKSKHISQKLRISKFSQGKITLKALSLAIFAGCVVFGVPSVGAAESVAVAAENTGISISDNTDTNQGLVALENDLGRSKVLQSESKEDSFALGQSSSGLMATQNGVVTGFAAPEVLGDDGTVEFLQEKPIDTPTLDYLHDNNVKIPQQNSTPILAPESGYSLTEVQTAGDNVITKYETVEVTRYYDKTTGELVTNPVEGGDYKVIQEKDLVPHYYRVNTPTSELGGSLGTSSSVDWQKVDAEGENTVSVKLPNGTTEYYQYTYTAPDGYDTTTYSGQTNDLGTITNPRGTWSAHGIYGGKVLTNPSGATTSLENYLFKDNKTTAIFTSTTYGSMYADLLGGAIYNAGEITKITADFVGNGLDVTTNRTSGSMYGYAMGGAIANVGTIGNITGDFINNSVNTQRSTTSDCYDYAHGGAIYNGGTIGDITGDFIGNYAQGSYEAYGGAIYNGGTIGDITGDFIGNYAQGSYEAYGGAIYNSGTIRDITGDFIGNYVELTGTSSSYYPSAEGGAIYNESGKIGNITGDFIGNYAQSTGTSYYPNAHGGAIYNYAYSRTATIGDITGDFIGNYAQGSSAEGGAISNNADYGTATIGDITGDFIGNYAQGSSAYGGAIHNDAYYSGSKATVGNITGDFIGNYVVSTGTSSNSYANGGAIYNHNGSTIGDITGDFIGNYAQSTSSSSASGGAIYNYGTIGDITGDFIGNYAQGSNTYGGAIYNSIKIGNITGDFIGNYAGSGGAIYNDGTIGDITGDFIANYARHSGGAIYNDYGETIGNITGDFIGNYAGSDGAIRNDGTIGDITGDFIGNYAQSTSYYVYGGAIRNVGTIGDITGDFIGNYVESTGTSSSSYAYGGAIYNGGTIGNITGDFIGNYAQGSSYAYGGAIYNYTTSGTVTIGDITGDFIGNYTQSTSSDVKGGAISNYAEKFGSKAIIGDITGDFIGNYAKVTGSSSSSEARGGAIYNYAASGTATIGDITGDFIGNYAHSTSDGVFGGAIYNGGGTIGDITGDFIGNYAELTGTSSYLSAYGGAISNGGTIGDITGDFIGNYAELTGTSSRSYAKGGAIYNGGTIGNITGDFIGNYVEGSYYAYGGAINNYYGETIGNITGDFIGNYAQGSSAYGGAIYNERGTIGKLTGDFIGNYAQSTSSSAYGGAIYNTSTNGIGLTNNKFLDNYAKSETGTAQGGAIWTNADLTISADNGTSEFTGNYIQVGDGVKDYQAIYTAAKTATTTYQSASSLGLSYSGYVYTNSATNVPTITFKSENNGSIILNDKIAGEVGSSAYCWNYSSATTSTSAGNEYVHTYRYLDGDYNTTDEYRYYYTSASTAIDGISRTVYTYQMLNEDNTDSDKYRYWYTYSSTYVGGKSRYIYTYHMLNEDNTETETYRYWSETSDNLYIYHILDENNNEIKTIKNPSSNFIVALNNPMIPYEISNSTIAFTGDSTGHIYLNNNIEAVSMDNGVTNLVDVTLDNTTLHLGVTDSENNKSDVLAQSNVTVNSGVVDTVDGKYTNYTIGELNSSEDARYSIDMVLSSDEQKSDTFTLTEGGSGTVYLSSINVTQPAQGDYNTYIIQIIKSATDNAPQLAYDDSKVMKLATANMTNDTILADGFGLYTTDTLNDSIVVKNMRDVFSEWANLDTTEDKTFTFVNGSNYVLSSASALKGENISIVGLGNKLDVNNKEFLDNVTSSQKVTISDLNIVNANKVNNNGELNLQNTTLSAEIKNTGELNLQNKTTVGNVINNGDVVILDFDKTSGVGEITGTGNLSIKNSELTFDSTLSGQNIQAENSTITLNTPSMIVGNSLSMTDSSLNINNLGLTNLHFNNFAMNNGTVNISNVDVDLANERMGRISSDNYGTVKGSINVGNLNLLSYTDKLSTDLLFADKSLATKVNYGGASQIAYSPIYKYDVSYRQDSNDGLGYFNFVRSGIGSNNSSDGFNPAVVATPVAAQSGATSTMNQTFNYAFQNSSNFMNIPYLERIAIKNANKYAISPTGNATDVGTYSPIFTKTDSASVWVKPYASFENIPLKNGPKVSNITYGTLVGFDTQLIQMKHGWDRVWTGYIGYNGASQRYSGVNSTQNGGLLGGTLTLYKGNFFNATTISAGASVAENTNMYGHENFSMLLAGIGNKAGYNFEFKEGKIIIQPSLLMSYTFVNTFDYTNAAGVRIKSDPLHSIQLSPGVKFIGNTKTGWQPYIGVNMVWNILDKSNVHANDVKLPEMSIKPYVQYGVGVQKRFKDKCMAFGQAMIQNGGRNGISLTAGFRWSLGKEGKPIEKVQAKTEKLATENQINQVKHEKQLKEKKILSFGKKTSADKNLSDTQQELRNRVNSQNVENKTILKQLTPSQKAMLNRQNTSRTTNIGVIK